MLCFIYKSIKKEGAYLYILKKDDFSSVPEALIAMFGRPQFVMVLNLDGRTLSRVDIEKVKESLQKEGFFLQLPPAAVENVLEQYKQLKYSENIID